MSILYRNNPSYYCIKVRLPCEVTYTYTKFINVFEGETITPYKLVLLLELFYKKRRFKLKRKLVGYLKESQTFLKKYGEEKALHLMTKAAEICTHPWGFVFLNKLGLQYYPDV
jgi:hypothetical protein